jgi:hypothetical protein
MKPALAGSYNGRLRATAKNVVFANDFSIFLLHWLARSWLPSKPGTACWPFDAASSRKVHAGFGQPRGNGPEFALDRAEATAIARTSRSP